MINCIKKSYLLFCKYFARPTDESKLKTSKIKKLVKAAKYKYFIELLSNSKYAKQSVKSLCGTLLTLYIDPGKKKKSTNIDKLVINTNTITNDNNFANTFYSYFSSIGQTLSLWC